MRRRPWTSDPVALAVAALAAARLTRLATTDTWPPAAAAREAAYNTVARRAPDWAHGVDCPWCVAPWVAAAVVAGFEAADRAGRNRVWVLACLPLAIAQLVGMASDLEPA